MKTVLEKTFLLGLSALASLPLSAQLKLETKQYRLSDFHDKPLMVVLTGNKGFDNALRHSLPLSWNISAFEFCSRQTFGQLKNSDNYYFLVTDSLKVSGGHFSGMMAMAIGKGRENADKTGMFKVTAIPLCSPGNLSGRVTKFLPAMVTALQSEVETILKRPLNAGRFVEASTSERKDYRLVVDKEDLAEEVTAEDIEKLEADGLDVNRYSEAGDILAERLDDCSVAYSAGSANYDGSYNLCVTMVFDASNWKLRHIKVKTQDSVDDRGFDAGLLKSFLK